jgi:hypothetical protein
MHASIRSTHLFAVALMTLGGSLYAQSDRRDPVVTLFSQSNFTGERIVLFTGDKIDDFNFKKFPSGRTANNRVSSIRVEGAVEVTLFLYREFSGEQITVHDSVPRLSAIYLANEAGNWDNELSSIVVRELTRRGPEPRHCTPDIVGPVVAPEPRNNRDQTRPRAEFRHGRNETARIVKNAYLDVLDREPDAAGLAQYVGIVEDRGWSEDRLRQELRRSREYQVVTVPKKITEAYQALLNRKPDSAGLSFYTTQIVKRGWTETRVRDALKRSPEYAQKTTFRRPRS